MSRTVQREIRKRGFFGWMFLVLFLTFNALMCAWLVSYWAMLGGIETHGSAEQAGQAIGGTIGSGVILFFWVAGAVILGLIAMLTRGRKTIITEDV
jgi:hypothetical protein